METGESKTERFDELNWEFSEPKVVILPRNKLGVQPAKDVYIGLSQQTLCFDERENGDGGDCGDITNQHWNESPARISRWN